MGTVVLSIDAELIGGVEAIDDGVPSQLVDRNRHRWRRLVELFDRHDIPATWAVVGRLFLESRPRTYPPSDSWFPAEDGTERADVLQEVDENIAADDLVDRLVDAEVNHEIASHSYSHPRFPDLSATVAADDVTASVQAARQRGLNVTSFVYPFNLIEHRSALDAAGLRCYRGRPPNTPGERKRRQVWSQLPGRSVIPGWVKALAVEKSTRISEFIWYVAGGPPPLVDPSVDEYGLVAIPSSMPSLFRLSDREKRFLRRLGHRPIERKARQGIDAAAEEDGIFHAWFHPSDLRREADFACLDRILDYLHRQSRDGAVDLATMDAIARETLDLDENGGRSESAFESAPVKEDQASALNRRERESGGTH